jgi:hypothetical protein
MTNACLLGEKVDYEYFAQNHFLGFYRAYRDTIRSIHQEAVILLQGATMEVPPKIKGTPDDENNIVYAPHWCVISTADTGCIVCIPLSLPYR